MTNILQLLAIILAGVSVGIADALIKKITLTGSFWSAFKNQWMIIILLLYLAQIIFFIFLFKQNWNLGIVGNIQIVFYSITIILSGLIIFGENISIIQGIGIGLALIGVVLMNL